MLHPLTSSLEKFFLSLNAPHGAGLPHRRIDLASISTVIELPWPRWHVACNRQTNTRASMTSPSHGGRLILSPHGIFAPIWFWYILNGRLLHYITRDEIWNLTDEPTLSFLAIFKKVKKKICSSTAGKYIFFIIMRIDLNYIRKKQFCWSKFS